VRTPRVPHRSHRLATARRTPRSPSVASRRASARGRAGASRRARASARADRGRPTRENALRTQCDKPSQRRQARRGSSPQDDRPGCRDGGGVNRRPALRKMEESNPLHEGVNRLAIGARPMPAHFPDLATLDLSDRSHVRGGSRNRTRPCLGLPVFETGVATNCHLFRQWWRTQELNPVVEDDSLRSKQSPAPCRLVLPSQTNS
jgi:hypothetical protein